MKLKEEVDGRGLRSQRWPPSFEASLAECSGGGKWREVECDGVRRGHGEPRRKDADECFGLRDCGSSRCA